VKKVDDLIVHISDSTFGSAREIRRWHMDPNRPGGPFKDIGYHFVILNGQILPNFFLSCLGGSIEIGRQLDGDSMMQDNEIGAHCLGYNDHSIGICGVGKGGWQPTQIASLLTLCKSLMRIYGIPPQNVLGHCETESGKKEGKTCPNLDMAYIREHVRDL
jgi:N-acetylmuramoyl-L-alanine amidase